jgi:hypothetical protein
MTTKFTRKVEGFTAHVKPKKETRGVTAREDELMRRGIKGGYFLALQHIEEALGRRLVNMDDVSAKWSRVGNFREVERIAHRRELVLSILDMLGMHEERIKKAFDFEGVKVL